MSGEPGFWTGELRAADGQSAGLALNLDYRESSLMKVETTERLERIEANVAHLEHQVEQLNGVIIEQGKLLERLKKEVQRQSASMETLELERIKANNPKPPHYQ